MLVFVDTEFTSFDKSAQLLSIGFVSEKSQSDNLYREVTGVPLSPCSDFVVKNVLPHLSGGDIAKEFQRVALDVWNWLAAVAQENPVEIAIDWAGDWAWTAMLLDVAHQYGAPSVFPPNVVAQPRNIWSKIGVPQTKKLSADWMKDHGLIEHHALHDALRNRMAYLHFSDLPCSQHEEDK